MKNLLLSFLLLPVFAFAQNRPPSITNVRIELAGNNILKLTYDLSDMEGDASAVTFRATQKGGLTFDYNTANATGAIGANIAPGDDKIIEWDYSAYASAMPDFRLMLVADDGQPVDIQAIVNSVDSTRLYGDLAFMEGIRHRTTGAWKLQQTKDFIRYQFQDNGLLTDSQSFTFSGYKALNIIGKRIGASEEAVTYILDGHYDSVDDAPGADDNASAVAGMLEAMRLLAPYSFKKSIKFIGFDLEEDGLVGSARYTQTGIPAGETTAGVINFEMIGYYTEAPNTQETPLGFALLFPVAYGQLEADMFRGNFITNVGGGNSTSLANSYANFAAQYVPELKVITLQPTVFVPDLSRSDHASFWAKNIPAIMLTDGAEFRNENYHTPYDKIETLNFTFMSNVVKAAIATLAELAEIQHAGAWHGDTEFFTATKETAACELSVTPNPANESLHFSLCLPGVYDLELLDITGRSVVRQKAIERGILDVSGLALGVYFLRLSGKKGNWSEQVVVRR